MRQLLTLVLAVGTMLAPGTLIGQRRSTPTPPPHPAEPAGDDQLSEFTHAVELQASPRQALHFNQFVESTAKARERARGIAARAVADILHGADPLIDLLDDVQWERTRFLASFTPAQKSGLKPLTKKLGKTNSEINRQTKALQAARASANETEIVAASVKLEEALGKFQGQQQAIAREMGISDENGE